MSLLKLNAKGVGDYDGRSIDIQQSTIRVVDEIVHIVQAVSGDAFSTDGNRTGEIKRKLAYIFGHVPIEIPIRGTLKISSVKRKCTEAVAAAKKIERNIAQCLANKNNNVSCLTNLSRHIRTLQGELSQCTSNTASERKKLQDQLNASLAKYLGDEGKSQRCISSVCRKEEARLSEIRTANAYLAMLTQGAKEAETPEAENREIPQDEEKEEEKDEP